MVFSVIILTQILRKWATLIGSITLLLNLTKLGSEPRSEFLKKLRVANADLTWLLVVLYEWVVP